MQAPAWRANLFGPLHEQASRCTLHELFLRPSCMSQDRCSSEPRRLHEFAHCVKPLRRAPSELAADDLGGAHDARRASTRSTGEAHAPERIGERADLLATTGVGPLCFGERLAPADQPSPGRAVPHLYRPGAVPALPPDRRPSGDPPPRCELLLTPP